MANLLDYLRWRGDLSFEADPFNEIDNLILSELCYLDFAGIVPGADKTSAAPVPLKTAAKLLFEKTPPEAMHMGLFVPHAIVDLCLAAAASRRFADIGLYAYDAKLDEAREMQFAALTFRLPDNTDYAAFRGTDDTLVGWKEDLNLAILPAIPAQKEAAAYLAARLKALPDGRALRVGGHSKGGNLAVYAAMTQPLSEIAKIRYVYNNDGPGFRTLPRNNPGYRVLADRMVQFTPENSVVGSLLDHDEDPEVLESEGFSVYQHDGFNWQLMGNRFLRAHGRTKTSEAFESTLKGWIASMGEEDAKRFISLFFKVLSAGGAKTLSDISEEKLRSAYHMTATLLTLDKPTRDTLFYALRLFFKERARVMKERKAAEKEAPDTSGEKAKESLV